MSFLCRLLGFGKKKEVDLLDVSISASSSLERPILANQSFLPDPPPHSKFEEELHGASWKNSVSFIPPVSYGKVIKVYDGDTITIATKLYYDPVTVYRFSVRLRGIDSAEIKGKTVEEKELAVIARDALIAKILGNMVELRNVGVEKYGRLLADVYLGDVCINGWMLENKYAVPYDGGTKTGF
jgi:endonuclease YncB( thermonuclease family)